jgi:predicted ATP-grasp superfamily ATP-dependent carboligase
MSTEPDRKTVLVTAAGGGAGNNLIRALRACWPGLGIIGTNIDRFYLARSLADRNYLVPRAAAGGDYLDAIRRVVAAEQIDLVIPQNDAEVAPLGRGRAHLGARMLLSGDEAIERCQDKFALYNHLTGHGIRMAETYQVCSVEDVGPIFRHFGSPERLWCRMRRGSASKGSLPVKSAEQARFWIRYWEEMRGVLPNSFLLSEYLPGRDFAFQSLWNEGELVLAKTCERLSYLVGEWRPSGTSSTPRVGKLVREPEVNQACTAAVRAVDPRATGMFCIDLKQDRNGVPCITEINIGRFFMISPVFHAVGRHNMAELYLRLAFGAPVDIPGDERFDDIGNDETFLVRELDNEPAVLTESHIEASYRTA